MANHDTLPIGISMVIPIYNTGPALDENLSAIEAQPFVHDHEVILVDDGSTDELTLEIIEDAKRKYSHIGHIAIEGNSGVQIARSTGVRTAKYKYVQTIDGDDKLNTSAAVLENGTFADIAIAAMESDGDIAFVHPFSAMFGDYEGPTITSYPISGEQVLEKHHMYTSIVYRKEDGVDSGLYHPAIKKWQDWSFAIALLNTRLKNNEPLRIACADDFYHMYRVHAAVGRISAQEVSELDMVRTTINLYPDIFGHHYPDIERTALPQVVLGHKPDRLI
ncbi:MAG: glycosyltransferase, partial [Patescibacteria group bacterium]